MAAFEDRPRSLGRGVGGTADYFVEDARISFEHADGSEFDYILDVRVAVPTDANADYPSFLGMDFLSHFRITLDFAHDLVELR